MKPKKSLGQHFLHDEKALKLIVSAADLKTDDKVLEIGPGKGVLTEKLFEKAKGVIAIEKDEALALELQNKFSDTKIIEGDILECNLPKLIEQNDFYNYKVVANIPYYITGKIIRLLFETKYSSSLIVLLVQKEVAERITSTKGKMSILSNSVQYFGTPEIIDYVSKECFDPVPKVDSAILKIIPKADQKELRKNAKNFFKTVKIGFSSRRKTLVNNLSSGLKIDKKNIIDTLKTYGVSERTRAQELGVEDWKRLEKIFYSKDK